MRMYRLALLTGISALALSSTAYGQQAQSASDALDEIVVSGTRIVRDGYEAPTPVTVAPIEDLLKAAPTNIPDALNQLPQFRGSTTPIGGNTTSNAANHGNVLNLRGFGGGRTLIMLDGVRVPATNYTGTVDVNIIPNLLVQRVDVVTAGASAAYGSDAITGVVNFILNDRFEGVKGVLSTGISQRGDSQNYRFSAAGGFAIGERTHIVISGERYRNDGFLKEDRPYLFDRGQAVGSVVGSTAAPGSAANPFIFVANAGSTISSLGGFATSGPFGPTGPSGIAGQITFPTPGTYRPINRGTPTGSAGTWVGSPDYFFIPGFTSEQAALWTNNGLARVTHDITDDIAGYAQVIVGDSSQTFDSYSNADFTRAIFRGNAYLPDALNAQLTSTNTASFNLSKSYAEFGPRRTKEDLVNHQFWAGLRGRVFDGFNWNVDYVYGRTRFGVRAGNELELPKLIAAVDAVRDANNNIVCRPSIIQAGDVALAFDPATQTYINRALTAAEAAATRTKYADCAPLNPFGFQAASSAAATYVTGVSTWRSINSTNDITASISGDVFDLPAGPVSVALGAEWRNQKLDLESNANPAVPQDVLGLRGTAATRFYLTNVGLASGKISVKEGFGEVAVPLIHDTPFIQSLDFNGAARVTDYSTSGTVTTWKAGATWAPAEDIRFRLTRSHDIRAPTMFNLYAGQTFTRSAPFDPHTNITGSLQGLIGGGNPDLEPETANTFTTGFVLQPGLLAGVGFSFDYYDIKLENGISTPGANTILTDCELSNGTAPICDLITRPLPFSDRTPQNFPTFIRSVPTNISKSRQSGIDLDISYRTTLAENNLTVRGNMNYIIKATSQQSLSQPTLNNSSYGSRWTAKLSADYEIGNFGVFVQERIIGRNRLGSPTQFYVDEYVSTVLYTDATLSYKIEQFGGNFELYLNIANLFDRKAPYIAPIPGAPGFGLSTDDGLYDVIGRAFNGGIRFNF